MPWTPANSYSKTHSAETPKKKQMWSAIANNVLSKTGSDSSAIKIANAAVARYRPDRAKVKIE